MKKCVCAAAILVFALFCARAGAQCSEGWLYGPGQERPASGAPMLWDPDGPGPQPATVVWSGNFYLPGKPAVLNQRVAIYTPTGPQILGDEQFVAGQAGGSTGNGGTNTITVHNNELYLCGSILTIGSRAINNVARWDGAHWQPVGTGIYFIAGQSTTANNIFSAGGSLFIYTKTNSGSVFHFAKWNGTSWIADPFPPANSTNGIGVTQGPDAQYITGNFTTIGGVTASRIARFDGTAFTAVGPITPMFDAAPAICFYSGVLHAFGQLAGANAALYKLVGGVWVLVPGAPSTFQGLTEYNGSLYGAGPVGNFGLQGWWKWDGSAWTVVGLFNSATPDPIPFAKITQTAVLGGTVYFASSGLSDAPTAGQWDGVTWRAMGGGTITGSNATTINSFQEYNGNLYVGGFTFALAPDGTFLRGLVRWTSAGWQATPTPFDSIDYISGLGLWKGQLLVGHTVANSSTLSTYAPVTEGLSRWDGTNWRTMTTGFFTRNSGANGIGPFTTRNGRLYTQLPSLAYWDDTSWVSVLPAATPLCLIDFNSRLYIGGNFTGLDFDRIIVNRVAMHDGVTWRTVGNGMNHNVSTFAVYQGQLIALGRFSQADATPASGIARWTGSRWEGIPTTGLTGAGDFQFTHAIEYAGDLYATGPGQLNGVTPAASIFRWNGQQWNILAGDAPEFAPSVLAVHSGELFMSGVMGTNGSGYRMGWGRWFRAGVPVISAPPADAAAATGGSVALSATFTGGTTFQWQHETAGVFSNMIEGAQPSGAIATGTQTPSLSLTGVHSQEAGRYRLVISSACAAATTFPATVTVTP